jgi:signal transduction histidine kinase
MAPLEKVSLFSQLPPEQLAALQRTVQERHFTAGEPIFREGDAGDGMYVIKSGLVELAARLNDADESRVFACEGPGAYFGEMAMVDNQPRSASAIARDETTAYFIPRESLLAVMGQSPAFLSSLMQGITQRLREFNRQYVDELIQSERLALVGRFTRSIVHDLKNPLHIIGIASDMAASPQAGPEARQTARERIRQQINRISNLVNEVVEFTRGSSSTFVLAPVEFPQLVRQVLDELKQELRLSSVELELLNEPPAVKVPANPERLLRVFHNLCGNAAEAMPDGGRIRFAFALESDRVVTTISDTGPGIAPEIVDKLFTAFVTHGKPNGTGLGLSICQRIIEDHRGRISGGNAPDGGAQFSFSLPLTASSRETTIHSHRSAPAA